MAEVEVQWLPWWILQQFSKYMAGIKCIFKVTGTLCRPLHNSQGQQFRTIFTEGTPPQKLQTDWEKMF